MPANSCHTKLQSKADGIFSFIQKTPVREIYCGYECNFAREQNCLMNFVPWITTSPPDHVYEKELKLK